MRGKAGNGLIPAGARDPAFPEPAIDRHCSFCAGFPR